MFLFAQKKLNEEYNFAKTQDLRFLGTTQAHHHVSQNAFFIIVTFHPKIKLQTKLFLP